MSNRPGVRCDPARLLHIGDCYKLGVEHYACALLEIERLKTLSASVKGQLVRGCDGGISCWSMEQPSPRCRLGQECNCKEACGDDLRAA